MENGSDVDSIVSHRERAMGTCGIVKGVKKVRSDDTADTTDVRGVQGQVRTAYSLVQFS